MTIKETLFGRCLGSGLFESQAEPILQMTYDEGDNELKSRWNDNADDYPDILINILWVAVCRNAVIWIDKNCPKHWARPFFVAMVAINENSP
jgi:hypothetical protein